MQLQYDFIYRKMLEAYFSRALKIEESVDKILTIKAQGIEFYPLGPM